MCTSFNIIFDLRDECPPRQICNLFTLYVTLEMIAVHVGGISNITTRQKLYALYIL